MRVTILHATEWAGIPFLSEPTRLQVMYEYVPDDPSELDLQTIFRQNNAVDGTERNVEHEARSLSVGDVVMISDQDEVSCHLVDSVGFRWIHTAVVSAMLGWEEKGEQET